ncbi:chemotaxis protein CheY [Ameyamaea chiangmaiensis NBRC 103196]|uniref:Response regulator n=1 Tax=Ameyamaea chiangmaiensis TaxID=442969 RepID=A0A850P883_9PROT|nr:response regulator [Ameyamaea chiangmaiensis]MBS4076014.1 response regulator [Ameyamaea chiangmaiensis]NVN40118.1 response regulator [Ameyamaea chiangmaiensis]GBQ61455.1 chemotaxis protein CheY [Ameyamaea chiangmaiensis NBRC 103196]
MPVRILTVDDSPVIRQMLRATLEPAGYITIPATDGVDGLSRLDQEEAPDVIITDLNMPNLDGYGFVEAVRRRSDVTRKPILVLTTEHSAQKRNAIMALGATGWITKPFVASNLLKTVQRLAPLG